MLAKTDVARIYETILSIPGMNDNVKITFQMPRKNVLLLSKIIERGVNPSTPSEGLNTILELVPKETLQDLANVAKEILEKTNLTTLNENLQAL